MNFRRLFIVAAVLLIAGVICMGAGWNGDAGVDFSSSLQGNRFRFCGSAQGLSAIAGLFGLLSGAVLFLAAFVGAVIAEGKR
jgi:hypothetical protein